MINIVIADDHALVRAGLCRLLESKDDIRVVGETGTGRETIDLCEELKPDVLLLDLDMPDIDGLEVTRKLVGSRPDTKILILTMHDHDEYAIRLIQAGALGFIVKGSSPSELPDAIRKVASGKLYMAPPIMEKLFNRQQKTTKDNPLTLLSEREMQVMVRLSQGMGINDIAKELTLSTSTVGTYKRRILDKLGLENISELVRFAMRFGLIKKF